MPFPSVPASKPLPLDAVGSAAAAYSLWLLDPDYAGNCLEVRRASDNALANIGFVDGFLDVVALEAHCAGTDGYIRTWYDQSGNAANAVQTTNGSQPQIVASGAVIKRDGTIRVNCTAKSLTVTLAGSIASTGLSWVGVIQRTAAIASGALSFLVIKSGANTAGYWQDLGQSLKAISYATPGGSAYQTPDRSDIESTYARPTIAIYVQAGATVSFYRNDVLINGFTATQHGAGGTTLQIGDATAGEDFQTLIVYGRALTQVEITAVYESVNAQVVIGPLNRIPTVAIEERHSFDGVLRGWLYALDDADFDVDFGAGLTWDDTYTDTDQLLRIAADLTSQTFEDALVGLKLPSRWFRLLATYPGDYGIESATFPHSGAQTSPGVTRWLATTNHSISAPMWAVLYSMDLPLDGGGQGNPFYLQDSVAYRALAAAITFLLTWQQEVDRAVGTLGVNDFYGGAVHGALQVFHRCRNAMPKHVDNAVTETLKFCATRMLTMPARAVNANMDCKGVEARAGIYAYVDDADTRDICVRGTKLVLFGSETGTPETSTSIYSPAGHIMEGGISALTPETTYNGHSLYHLVGAMYYVRGDATWNFLQTVLDQMAIFKFRQHFLQPDGTFDGPSGYAGRTGGGRVNDQGIEGWTRTSYASFSQYARPIDTALSDEATIVASINSGINALNSALGESNTLASGTAACHTNGVDTTWREVTSIQISPTNTLTSVGHGLQNDERVFLDRYVGASSAAPGGLSYTPAYWIVNRTDDTVQLSLTQGGAAIAITSAGTHTRLSLCPVVYLTNSPNLSYTPSNEAFDYLEISVGGNDIARLVESVDDTSKLLGVVDPGFSIPSGSPIDYAIINGPRHFVRGATHWPATAPYYPDDGYYVAQRARIVANDNSLKTPWQLTATFNDTPNDEFWLYKDTDGTRQFGWMIEHLELPGDYGGWFGGGIQALWVEDLGTILMARHDKTGNGAGENTRIWSLVDTWATQQVWGLDTNDKKFSSAWSDNKSFTLTNQHTGAPKYVSLQSESFGASIDVSAETGIGRGLEPGSALTGTFAFTNTFTAETDGLTIQQQVTHTGTDNLKELWATVPVFLRDGTQSSTTEATIMYWAASGGGGTWVPLTTDVVEAEWMRIGRDFGSGAKYIWINFAVPTRVCLNAAVWVNTYQGDGRYRTIKIDLHGDPGTSQAWPASVSTTYTITTTDPGLTITAPSVGVQFPVSTTVFPEGRRWAFRATVDWINTTGTVVAEYTTNGTDWSSVGSMTNVTSNIWDYVGGTVPSGVVAVRVRATPPSGDEGIIQLASTSAPETLVLEDNFTAADATAVNASYTSWTTNTTGNAYANLEGTNPITVTSNAAGATGDNNTTTQFATVIDVDATDHVAEALIKFGSSHAAKRCGVISRIGSSTAFINASANPGYGFNLRWLNQGGFGNPASTPPIYDDSPLPSTSTTYRIVLQTIGNCCIADIYDGVTLLHTFYRHGLTSQLTDQRVGFVAPTTASGGTLDAFKVWKI